MRVGILGGSFNPPHQGHIHISELAIKKLKLDQVWWIVTKNNPLKQGVIFEAHVARLTKCEKLIQTRYKLRLRKFDEIYTEKLLLKLKARYKNIDFFWLMGADSLENFHRWKNFKKIISLTSLAIFSREVFLRKIKKTKAWGFAKRKNPKIFFTKNINISSTEIRNSSHV